MSTGKDTTQRIAHDDYVAIKKYRREMDLSETASFTEVLHKILEAIDPVYIAKLRNELARVKAEKTEIARGKKDAEDRLQALAIDNNKLHHEIDDKNETIKSLHDPLGKLFRENRDLRLKLDMQPLGNTVEEALLQLQKPEQKPLAFTGMAMEDLINKVDSTREAIDNANMLLTEDYNRLSEGMAVLP